MTIQNTTELDEEDTNEVDVIELEIIEGLDDLEEEEKEAAIGYKLNTKIEENDGEDNYFDEAYFEE